MLGVVVVQADRFAAASMTSAVSRTPEYTVLGSAHSARSAELRRHRGVDLLLVDLELPDGSGLELMAEFDVDAVVTSAAADPATVRPALRRGAVGYLVKPFTAAELRGLLGRYARYRDLLSGPGPLRQPALDRALRALHGNDTAARRQVHSSPSGARIARLLEAAGAPLTAAGLRPSGRGRPQHEYRWLGAG